MSEKKYVPEGVYLACNKGTCPSQFRISQRTTSIYGKPMATEIDLMPFFNIKPMGFCSATLFPCLPTVLKWDNPQEGVTVGGFKLLKDDSTAQCMSGGKIDIHFTRASASEVALWGNVKMPTEYIKEGFDWLEENNATMREVRDQHLPEWLQGVAHAGDWMVDLQSGLVEGAITGVVGLGETVYQVAQDPVGTAEAIGGMASDAWDATTTGVSNATDWASSGENWSNAANGAWDWVSSGENWSNAANGAWEGTKDAASWVADNPRAIGTTVGEFIPDVAAAVYTMGGTVGISATKIAIKETAEEAVEKAVKEGLEEAGERAAREGLEEAGEKAGREVLEEASKEVVEEIPEVVVKSLARIKKIVSEPFKRNSKHDLDEFMRQLKGQEAGLNNLTVDDFIKNRDEYLRGGRSHIGDRAQREYREQYREDMIEDLMESQEKSFDEAESLTNDFMDSNAALHDPDQVAGGFGDNVTGMGDRGVNSSLGSQWKDRIDEIDSQVRDAAKDMSEVERKTTYLDIELPIR